MMLHFAYVKFLSSMSALCQIRLPDSLLFGRSTYLYKQISISVAGNNPKVDRCNWPQSL